MTPGIQEGHSSRTRIFDLVRQRRVEHCLGIVSIMLAIGSFSPIGEVRILGLDIYQMLVFTLLLTHLPTRAVMLPFWDGFLDEVENK